MTGRPDLRRVEEIFWELIRAPEGARAGLEAMTRRGALAPEEVEAIFAGDDRLPAVERLDVYANMYFFRLLDAVGEDFPKTRAAIGGARFHNLITDYVLRCPSRDPSLRHFGARLPGFVASHPIASEFPFLHALARLEWARVEVFDAPDAEPLTREGLARLAADRAGEATFTLVPASAVIEVDHAVAGVWRDLDRLAPGAPPDDPVRLAADVPARPTRIRVWRAAGLISHASLGEEEARCIDLLAQGEPLARICRQVAAGRSLAKATARVGALLQGWLDDGLLAGFSLPASS